jgi:uncharacterized protein (DUF2336 family)
MDLSFLDKSSGVTPLLVRLYDSQKLYGLAKDKKPLARAELTTAVSQLLEMQLSSRETELVADVLIALMRQAEVDLRQALAERLSIMDNVPLRVVLQIANDTIDVASPVLRNSQVLSDMDLIYIIKSKSAQYWQAIAARRSLSEHLVNLLAETRDFDTAVALAENTNIKLTEQSLTILSDLAQGREELASPLLRRDEVTNDIAAKLFQMAGYGLRQHILENFDIDTNMLISTVDEVILEFVEATDNTSFTPTPSMIKNAERYKEKGLLTINAMLQTLKRGQVQSFTALFAEFTGLTVNVVSDILVQPNGQGLAVACKAHDISKTDFISFFLLTNRFRNGGKMVDMKDMNRAIYYFDNIKPDVAQGIMKNSRGKKPH